jgi:N utilization substance protein A
MQHILEDVFRAMFKKKFETDEHIDIIVNIDKGDVQIFLNKEIVDDGEVEDPNVEIAYSDAIKIEPDFEIGEEVTEEFKFADFGRRNILSLRQNLISRILELEKDHLYKKYKERVGEIVTGEVYQVWKKEILVMDDDQNELLLPKSEQIPADFFKKGETVRAVVSKVDMRNSTPVIILSRTAPEFLERLFELEVPEVFDGLITIKKIVREPGERAKVAVESYDDRVDPVGACVGMKGSRIHGIVRELRNENIDVINYTSNNQLLIQRALSPAKISSLDINEEEKRVKVYLKPDQVSLAIGKGGNNIKLAGKLCGYEIDVYRDGEIDIEDVDLEEFADEIDSWIIDELKSIGCDTAKAVLEIGLEDLVKRTDLEKETIEEVFRILKAEFE